MDYIMLMEYELRSTEEFDTWVSKLRDPKAKAAVVIRLARVRVGNFGDSKGVGGGVSELRIDTGKGYRVYFTVRGQKVIFLLTGGNKKTQPKDIQRAREMAKELK